MADDPRAEWTPPATREPAPPSALPSGGGRLVRALGRRWVGAAIVALATALAAPSLDTGYQGDDYFVRAGLEGGLGDAFRFVDRPALEPTLLRLPWWAAPDLRIAFFRPLSALTHALDEALAPGSPVVAHAQSLLWFAALCAAALAVLRRLLPTAWLAHLALVVYALDDARGPTVGWISNRNALIAGALGLAALWAHDRARRDGWRPGRLLAPAAFAAALLAGEIGASTGALLLAHALVFEPGRTARRVAPLWPYVALGLGWILAHHLGGYGTHGAEGYLDPLDHPLAFLGRVATTTPVLLGAALGVWSDFFPAVSGDARAAYLAIDLAVVTIWGLFFRSLWRRFAHVRFGLLASVLATLPLAGGPAADRNLVFVSLGVALVTAVFLGQVLDPALRDPRQSPRVYQHLVRPTAAIVLVLWIGGGVLGLPARARSMAYLGRAFDETLALVRAEPDRPLLAVNLPSEGLFDYLAPICAARGLACAPAHALVATRGAVRVVRPDWTSLELEVADGLFETQADRMTTTANRFWPSQRIAAADGAFTVTILELGEGGRPTRVRFELPTLLEEGRRFVAWTSAGPRAWTPPHVGGEVTLEAIDPVALAARYLTAAAASSPSDRSTPRTAPP